MLRNLQPHQCPLQGQLGPTDIHVVLVHQTFFCSRFRLCSTPDIDFFFGFCARGQHGNPVVPDFHEPIAYSDLMLFVTDFITERSNI